LITSDRGQSLSWTLTGPAHRDLDQALPELDTLRSVAEWNDWHRVDAFRQSLRLFDWVKRLPGSLLEEIDAPGTVVQSVLASVVDPQCGHYTTHELLAFAALIHDIGKAETFQRLTDSSTRCPGHEAVSARMAPDICARFDFSQVETRYVTALVGAHGEPYSLFKKVASSSTPQQQERMRRFEAEYGHHLQSLLLLACGDLVTSDLQASHSQKYASVLDFYQSWFRSAYGRE
jgi:hypothetical protein